MVQSLQADSVVAGRYRIINQVHRGPMSTVYRVVDLARGEMAMVLKELVFTALPEAERAEAISWFLREAHLLSTLRHHSLPVLHASFSIGDRSYLVMEAVPGPSLEMRASFGKPSEDQVLRWGIEICEVLSFLHNQPEPIIYRDLKPANILERADTGELVLVDFGVARRATPGIIGTAVGTPGYAAPEQYQGFADERSDIYALGATLHRLLTGYNSEQEDPFRHPPFRVLRPEIGEATAAVIERALALDPRERYADAAEFRGAMRAALPASPDVLQAVTGPFYFWITVLPGVTAPLALVCFNVVRLWLSGQGFPFWSWPVLLLGVYAPAVLYV
ncbi:MAG: serine/threonine protein kinase, partial [Acetobacteraceae bacterium]|nr:serine/threonine protein kinase [Acetobacteraceae bacterium]